MKTLSVPEQVTLWEGVIARLEERLRVAEMARDGRARKVELERIAFARQHLETTH